MKTLYYLLLLCLPLSACTSDMTIDLEEHPSELIINGILQAGDQPSHVYLMLSTSQQVLPLSDGTLDVYINNRHVGTLHENTPTKATLDYRYAWEAYMDALDFTLPYPLTTGDVVRIEASANGGKYHARATTTIPASVEKLQVVHPDVFPLIYGPMEIAVTTRDLPTEDDGYRLYIKAQYRVEGKSKQTGRDTLITFVQDVRINHENDFILNDGQIRNKDSEDIILSELPENKFQLFNDRLMGKGDATLKVSIEGSTFDPRGYTPDAIDYTQPYTSEKTVIIGIAHLSAGLLPYWKTLEAIQYKEEEDIGLTEMYILPNNVEGGQGFLGAEHIKEYTIRCADIEDIYHRRP